MHSAEAPALVIAGPVADDVPDEWAGTDWLKWEAGAPRDGELMSLDPLAKPSMAAAPLSCPSSVLVHMGRDAL